MKVAATGGRWKGDLPHDGSAQTSSGANASDRLDHVLRQARAGERRRTRERLEAEAGKRPKRKRRPPPKWTYTVKIGRNDPCPCGSGKKFKRCCIGKT